MRSKIHPILFSYILYLIPFILVAQPGIEKEMPPLQNLITADYLKEHLTKTSPRLILTPAIERELQDKLKTDPLVKTYYQYLKAQKEDIMTRPLLTRKLQGFRLLFVSREMVERMGVLCTIYRIEQDPEILERINRELLAVCSFTDWNPQHFLDIAEMSFAVAMAIDWVGEDLPEETVKQAKVALVEKGIKPSYNVGGTRMFWINSSNNWNQVCHGGMIAASLAVAEEEPELAAKTIHRALEKLPNSLKEYGPDGVYPEGPGYWNYGTSYVALASSMLTTALGSDFGLSDYPGVLQSANFRLLATAPSGEFFNFADSDGRRGGGGSVLLAWFAAQTGDALYLDNLFFENPEGAGRLAGPGMVWLSQFEEKQKSELPFEWSGRGANPVAFFRGKGKNNYYLAAKGGGAFVSHGNMDAGSFIFELNDVRWVIDPGNQSYYPLNRIGFNLAGRCQECERWTLLTKKNQGHSTITVNNERHKANGYAPITAFKEGDRPEVTIDMTDILDAYLASAQRTFVKENDRSLLIRDEFQINDSTETVTWGLMTVADVVLRENGALLRQDGKELKLSILSPANLSLSVISLDPPPLEIDKTIKNLKRIELRVPAWMLDGKKGKIEVRLSEK